ncbi:hypothetical protein BFW01_g1723 [Lasiodiplodia theobromae]|uniref:Pyrrolo-quinoline quinone repeat domain-containing protein n=1 Tax=Lasiodiplodia theobromae TaxID=45133 RepID=A0A5N5CWQ1_9PEZI|nr:hypothetical protein DBV05_g11613 [Lasiodiplodia theobromae]KAF9641740.1 hypothetical protein BFW01_g1723 [Lasiodiplodia theobromae]
MEINWYFNWTNDKSNIVTPLVNRQGIYAGNVGQVALIPRDGTVAVHNDLPGLSTDEVRLAAPDDASLVVAGLHGHVVALDPVSLKERWRTNSLPDSGGEVVSVLCAAGQIYAGCNGYVFRFDPSGPQIKEQHYLDQGSHEVRLAMNHSESILFASYNSVVLALDPETLKEKWHKEMTEAGRSVVSIVSGKDVVSGKNFVYAGCRGYVYMFDESDGNQKT